MDVSHMAGPSSMGPAPDPSPQPSPRLPETLELLTMPADETPSPQSESAEDEDILYGDGDDAQSFIQPAISPVATRLTSPKVLAAERAAAMAQLQGEEVSPNGADGRELFGPRHTNSMPNPSQLQEGKKLADTLKGDGAAPPPSTRQRNQGALVRLPSPWHPGPRDFVVEDFKTRRPALSGVFGSGPRTQRASSIGDSAMRRLSRAFDSVNLPNFSSSSFFSSTSKDDPPALSSSALAHSRAVLRKASQGGQSLPQAVPRSGRADDADASRSSLTLQRTLSDDSALYHSLSRVSSYGDDERWTHIREQVNVRLKAIKDSWDAPTFKLPSIFPDSLKLPSPNPSSTALPQKPKGDGLYPALDRVLETLTGDIVILGGYRGSILRSSQPPHRQLWVPVKVGLNIRKVNLEVGLDPQDEEGMESHIFASGMLQNIGPVDISKRLFKRLRECDNARQGKLRVHDYGYDWRLSPALLSRKLVSFLESLPSNQPGVPSENKGVLVIAHSLGGLITRHAVNQRPELFSGVLYAGAPQRCINILGPVRNGDAVLLNEKVLTAQVTFSLRTTFVFLPEDGFCFVDKFTGEEYPIDFYNVDDWIKYRLSPMVSEPALPPLLPKTNVNNFTPSLRSLSGSLARAGSNRARSNSEGKKGGHLPSLSTPNTLPEPLRKTAEQVTKDRTLAPQMASSSFPSSSPNSPSQPSTPTTTTTPTTTSRETNIAYLRRTLAETLLFRKQLSHNPGHQTSNAYPPISVLYGKEIPTVYAARVAGGRAAIPCADAYDDLLFHSGDGVVLAREAMPPEGYEIVRGGRVSSDRGHITLLGDLAAVGRALEAVVRGRRKGIGLGRGDGEGKE